MASAFNSGITYAAIAAQITEERHVLCGGVHQLPR